MPSCNKCGSDILDGSRFCGKCGTKVERQQAEVPEQKSFKLDTSKEGNRRTLMGLGLLVGIKLLGPVVGSYLLAGVIVGALLFVVEVLITKSKS